MRVTTFINGKGGVAKTTSNQAANTGLPRKGYKGLSIDYDPQGNLSLAFGTDVYQCPTMYHVINGDVSLQEAIQHTPQGDIIVGNDSLTKLEQLFAGDDLLEGVTMLDAQLKQLSDTYTHIFIDNQPQVGGLLTLQSLTASTDVVIPMTAENFSVQGLTRLEKSITTIRSRLNPDLKIAGILLTRHNPRTNIGSGYKQVIEQWAKAHETIVYKTFIRESVSVKEAQAKRESLFAYAPSSNPAKDYKAFIREYLNQERG